MHFESTSIASIVSVVLETAHKSYNFDARPVLERMGVDLGRLDVPGARFPDGLLDAVLLELQRQTGDDCFGLALGRHVRPTTFHALGFAWLASSSLLDAFHRLERYDRIVATADEIVIAEQPDHYALIVRPRDPESPTPDLSVGAFFVAVLEMCRWIAATDPAPLEVHVMQRARGRAGAFVAAFGAPVRFEADDNRMIFDRVMAEQPVPGANAELAKLSDRVSEDYLRDLEPSTVAREVRALLLKMLPSGEATQQNIAGRLNRSCSSLQRDLRAEGTTFRQVREETRKALATDYVRRPDISLQEVAFLLGFSDQSNFSRAFRRWTGQSPKAWRDEGRI